MEKSVLPGLMEHFTMGPMDDIYPQNHDLQPIGYPRHPMGIPPAYIEVGRDFYRYTDVTFQIPWW